MQALRQIYKCNSQHISIKVPKTFMNRSLEIIIMPAENQKEAHVTNEKWPIDFFAKTAGCFSESPLVREAQGGYELRDTIR